MAKSPFLFKILSLYFWREKNLSPDFGVMVLIFFGLGRFSICWVVGLLKSFFWQEALRCWVPCSECLLFKRLRVMASLWDVIRQFIYRGGVFNLFLFRFLKRKAPITFGRHVVWFIIKDMDFIKTGRFFENPLVGRHVLNVRPKKGVNLSIKGKA